MMRGKHENTTDASTYKIAIHARDMNMREPDSGVFTKTFRLLRVVLRNVAVGPHGYETRHCRLPRLSIRGNPHNIDIATSCIDKTLCHLIIVTYSLNSLNDMLIYLQIHILINKLKINTTHHYNIRMSPSKNFDCSNLLKRVICFQLGQED